MMHCADTAACASTADSSFVATVPEHPDVCVFITAGPSTKLFTWGGGGIPSIAVLKY
jgi:hypothetical protein